MCCLKTKADFNHNPKVQKIIQKKAYKGLVRQKFPLPKLTLSGFHCISNNFIFFLNFIFEVFIVRDYYTHLASFNSYSLLILNKVWNCLLIISIFVTLGPHTTKPMLQLNPSFIKSLSNLMYASYLKKLAFV